MGMLLQNHAPLVFLVFVFTLNPQLSFVSSSHSSSNATLPNSPLMLCLPLQSQALLLFKSNFVIETYGLCEDSYPKTESWKEGTDCCSSWDGVTCDDLTGHVIGLDLSCSQIVGTIHSNNTLFSSHVAPHLQSLNLAGNAFYGSEISSEFGVKFGSSLTHLNLSNSGFSGNIPPNIFLLSNLVSLDLSSNNELRVEPGRVLERLAQNLTHLMVLNLDSVNLSPVHAVSLMNLSSSLTSLSLRRCSLQGKFPVSFLIFPNLQELDLSDNNFNLNLFPSLPYLNSTTPTSSNLWFLDLTDSTTLSLSSSIGLLDFVGNYHTSLSHLGLRGCNISGPIPPSLGNLTKLTHLDVSDNHLSGPIPPSLGNLIELTSLDLHINNLSGPIPASLGNPIQLTSLNLHRNHFSGSIPTSFSNLTHLEYLDLSDNELEGVLPSLLFDLPSLTIIDLSYNKLNGTFPSSPIKAMDLFLLDLSHNNISSSTTIDINLNYSLPNLRDLDLSSCNFNQFPAFMKALTNLASLYISNNHLQGRIPEWIYNVGKDTLSFIDLSGNQLTTVGSQIYWKNIQFIDLHSNLLQGSLPILPTSTRFFSASHNNLSGEVSSVFCNLSSINFIDLSYNQFTGSIPKCLGRLSDLSVLNLGMNNLHGVIPNSFAKNSSLNYLVLRSNNFTGKIPTSLVHCQGLQILDVSNNMIEDTFPYWLDTLSALEILVLRSNKFFGSLNSSKGKFLFPMVRILDLSNNKFTGELPIRLIKNLNLTAKMDGGRYMHMLSNDGGEVYYYSLLLPGTNDIYELAMSDLFYPMVITIKGSEMEYKKITTALAIIDLSRNKFEGHIPDLVGKLVSLKGLNLSHNSLTGHIPASMGDLVNLEWLDLSSNKLSEKIPTELADFLTFLAVLNLSHNRLDGPIPQGKQFNTFENDSYKDNLGLCGFPLSKSCGANPEPPPVDYEKNDLSDSESGFNWEGAFAGYGCGVVFGLSMGWVMFKKKSPKWFVRMVEGKHQGGRAGKRPKRGGRRRT